jgi:hypothetical protein
LKNFGFILKNFYKNSILFINDFWIILKDHINRGLLNMKCATVKHSWIYEEELEQVAETLNKWFLDNLSECYFFLAILAIYFVYFIPLFLSFLSFFFILPHLKLLI